MEYEVKAAFLYKFAQYATWPPDTFEDSNSPIIFGIAASEDIVDLVRRVASNQSIQGRPIRVRPITDEPPEKLHLLFVSRSRTNQLSLIQSKVRNQPTLLVTESDAGLDAGGIIDFHIEQEHVRFAINHAAAEQRGLQLSAQLMRVAREVRRSP